METIQEIREHTGDMADKCREMGELLGLSEPVSEAVLLGALNDSAYAHNLLVTRKNPAFLQHLLKNPPKIENDPQQADEKSSLELVKKATEAMWKWAKTGFSTVEQAVLDKRYNTCLQCPNLKEPPKKMVYKVVSANQSDDKICDLCGCVVANKVRLPSEACPDRHPTLPGVNRWEEPMK